MGGYKDMFNFTGRPSTKDESKWFAFAYNIDRISYGVHFRADGSVIVRAWDCENGEWI